MNENHAKLCGSAEWAAFLQAEVLPQVTRGVDLGETMLEIGPGPGAATDWLRHRVGRLIAVEPDGDAVTRLRLAHADTNVDVFEGDATQLSFADASFDSAGCFTMLHHVPTAGQQDAILAEVRRVVRPGGVFVGSDSLPSDELREFHEGDTYNPIPPDGFEARLAAAGFERISVDVGDWLSFVAYTPAPS